MARAGGWRAARPAWAPAAALVALLAVVLAGCTGSPASPGASPAASQGALASQGTPGPSASAPTPGPGGAPEWTATSTRRAGPSPSPAPGAAPPPGRLRLVPVGRVPVPAGTRVAGLALSASRVAWSGCAPCAGSAHDPTDVFVADLPGGQPRSVARTRFRWGSIRVIGFSGDVLVWLDGADVRDGGVPHARWALRAMNMTSGASWTVAAGGGRGDPPQTVIAFAAGGRVTWQLYDLVSSRGPVRTADLATRAVRTVDPALPGLLRGVSTRGLVHTEHSSGVRIAIDAPTPVDAYLTQPADRRTTSLTKDHDIADAAVDGNRVLWTTQLATGGALWSASASGGAPTPLFAGPVLTFAAGRGFGAWTTREALPVVQVGSGGPAATLPDVPADGGVLGTDGDRLAVLTVPDRGDTGPVSVRVVRVAAAG